MVWWQLTLCALAPIALILLAMTLLKKSAAVAGVAGLALTVLLVFFVFPFPDLAELASPLAMGLAGSFAEAGFTATTILWIIFGALCIHQLQLKTGAIDALKQSISAVSSDRRLVAILIAWFFALFMEGAAGFGTPIALAAPFLVGFGMPPVQAVTVVLIGHSVGVSFGAVGTPIMPQIAATDFSAIDIAAATARYHLFLGAVMLAFLLAILTRHLRRQSVPLVPIWPWFLIAALGFVLPMWAIARWVGPELPTMGGAIIGAAIFVLAVFVARRMAWLPDPDPADATDADEESPMALWKACAPYALVIALILVSRLIPGLQSWLQSIELNWALWDTFEGSFQPLYHPGTILVFGAIAGAAIQGASRQTIAQGLKKALAMLGPVAIALVAMLAISRLMVHASMIDTLAEAAARTGDHGWPVLAPVVGTLGTFVTGSATASNILFTDFQLATAHQLELDALPLVASQGFGAAVGNIICPHNIIAGCATVGIAGREGEVLNHTLGACALYVLLGGALAWTFVHI